MALFLDYIDKVKAGLHETYGCPLVNPNAGPEGGVICLDGIYPMEIDGKMDYVRIKDEKIYCCQWERPPVVTT